MQVVLVMQTIIHVLLILRVSTFSLESHFLKISLSLPFFNSKFLIGQLSKFVLGSEAEGSKTKEINIVLLSTKIFESQCDFFSFYTP